jgi:hypothetical protein
LKLFGFESSAINNLTSSLTKLIKKSHLKVSPLTTTNES